jgi:hypothetical protein
LDGDGYRGAWPGARCGGRELARPLTSPVSATSLWRHVAAARFPR